MKETKSGLTRPLVVGQRGDGRCRYDPEAKRELVESCLKPGVSVSRIALEHRLNANLLRKWIKQYHDTVSVAAPVSPAALPAFAPVLPVGVPTPVDAPVNVTLPNGVKLALASIALSDLPLILKALAELPCSVLKPD